MALFLPPLAGGERAARAARPRARAPAPRGAPRRTPSGARCARRRGCRASPRSWASRRGRSRRAWRGRRGRPRAPAPRSRRAPDRDRRAARRDDRDRRRAPDGDAARGRRGWPSTRARPRRAARPPPPCGPTGSAARRPRSSRRPRGGRALLVEELAVDAVRIAHEHVGAAAGAAQRAVGDGQVVADEVAAWCDPAPGTAPCRDSRSRPRGRPRRRSRSHSCWACVRTGPCGFIVPEAEASGPRKDLPMVDNGPAKVAPGFSPANAAGQA